MNIAQTQSEPENPDFEIQEVHLMPMMRLDKPEPRIVEEPEVKPAPEPPKTTYVL